MSHSLRSYTPLRMVLTVCGECFAENPDFQVDQTRDILQGNLVRQDGRVYLRRHCQRGHGEVVSLYEEDADLWEYLQQWRSPTREIVTDTPGNALPIPLAYEQGLGELQTQHSCILLVDINQACNLTCPTCFTASSPLIDRYLPCEDVLRIIDSAIGREGGELDVVMLSGGEPTIHPEFQRIVTEILERPVSRLLVNTNGVLLARDNALLDFLTERRQRVELYLQYDGPSATAALTLRGEDLRQVKDQAIERVTARGLFTTLVMTVARGLNEDDLGAVAQIALDTPYVCGVAYQPIFGSGRAIPIDPMDRVTTTGVLTRLAEQMPGKMQADDFIALPCSHPDCCAITYFLTEPGGGVTSVPRLLGHDRVREMLHLVSNTIAFTEARDRASEALLGLFSSSITSSRPELARFLRTVCQFCGLRASRKTDLALRMKRFTVKHFMDAWTMNIERLQQCCVHVGSPSEGEPRVPFCARQLFGNLRSMTESGQIGRAELLDLKSLYQEKTSNPA